MIKINLASSTSSGAAGLGFGSSSLSAGEGFLSGNELRKEALKRIFLLLIGPAALHVYEMQNIPAKYYDLDNRTRTLNELRAYNSKQASSVAEIKKFKEDEALIEARIAALEKISKDRNREIRVMDLLQTVMPEKAWLTKVQILPERVNIQGLALSDFEVSSFLESLTRSVLLMDVNLVSSSEVSKEGILLKSFEISCMLEKPE